VSRPGSEVHLAPAPAGVGGTALEALVEHGLAGVPSLRHGEDEPGAGGHVLRKPEREAEPAVGRNGNGDRCGSSLHDGQRPPRVAVELDRPHVLRDLRRRVPAEAIGEAPYAADGDRLRFEAGLDADPGRPAPPPRIPRDHEPCRAVGPRQPGDGVIGGEPAVPSRPEEGDGGRPGLLHPHLDHVGVLGRFVQRAEDPLRRPVARNLQPPPGHVADGLSAPVAPAAGVGPPAKRDALGLDLLVEGGGVEDAHRIAEEVGERPPRP
jgi:hypothetical protein